MLDSALFWAFALGAILGLFSIVFSGSKRTEVLKSDTESLQAICNLGAGRVSATLLRQSGNAYRELGQFHSREAALSEVQKSFRRAGIDTLTVFRNSETVFEVTRRVYNGRGRSEGKNWVEQSLFYYENRN